MRIKKGQFNRIAGKKLKMGIAGALALILMVSLITSGGVFQRKLSPETQTTDPPEAELKTFDPVDTRVSVKTPEKKVQQPTEDGNSELSLLLQKSQAAAERGDYEQALAYAEKCMQAAKTAKELAFAQAQKGNVLFALQDYAVAEKCYREILALQSAELPFTSGEINDMIARCLLLQNRFDEAAELCTAMIEQSADEDAILAGIYVLRGTAYMSGGSYDAARSDFRSAMELGYSDAELLTEEIAQCDALIGNPELAAQLSATGKSVDSTELAAVSAYLSGSYAQAAESYERLLGKGGRFTDAQTYASIAKCRLLLGQYDRAAENCRKGVALGESGEMGTLYALLGTAYMGKGENAAAAESFENALDHGYSDMENLLAQAAACYYLDGRYADCLRCGERMGAEAAPNETTLWMALSDYALGEYSGAVPLLEQSIGLSQSYCEKDELYRILSLCRFLTGDNSAAMDAAAHGLAESESKTSADLALRGELYAIRGTAELSAEQNDAALADFQSAAECGYAGLYDVYRQAAFWEFQIGNFDKAIQAGELALANGDGTGELYYVMGLSYLSLEKYSAAQKMLDFCESLAPETDDLYFYIGVCFFSQDDFKTAIGHFTRSVERGESQAQRSLYNRGLCYLQLENYEAGTQDVRAAAEQTENLDVAKDAAALLISLQGIL